MHIKVYVDLIVMGLEKWKGVKLRRVLWRLVAYLHGVKLGLFFRATCFESFEQLMGVMTCF